jgi:hypothetical protein
MTSGRKDSCRELFKQLNILPLQSQYIFSLLLFIIKNRDKLLSNSEVRNINTRYNTNLHLPLANLTIYQKGFFFYAGSRIYNHLPPIIKDLSNDEKRFKTALKSHFWTVPSMACRNILIKTCHDLGSFHTVINMKLVEL